MKKSSVFVLVLMLALLMPATALAAPKNDGKGNNATAKNDTIVTPTTTPDPEVTETTAGSDTIVTEPGTDEATEVDNPTVETTHPGKKPDNPQKVFKDELNLAKKELQQQKTALAEEKAQLEEEYNALVTAGDVTGAEALKTKLTDLNAEIDSLNAQIKTIINERYMVVKTMYSDEELTQFESAQALIEQMYADAKTLDAGSVTINNQLIKLTAPFYIKGGNIMVPVKAVTEKLDADVIFNEETRTLTITKDTAVIEISVAGVTAAINGEAVDITDQVAVTCGRTYIPLDLLAKIFALDTVYDEDTEIIDVDVPSDEDTTLLDDATATSDDSSSNDSTETPVVENPVNETPAVDNSANTTLLTPDAEPASDPVVPEI